MKLIDVSVLKEWVENWFIKNRFYHPYAKDNNIPITELYDILEQMPSAQPERKNRKWYAIGNSGLATCECGYITDRHSVYNFCPNCGADMRKE